MRFTYLLFTISLIGALIGCSKPNDTATLHDEVVAINNYYQPWVDAASKRGLALIDRGGKLGIAMPGGEVASRAISMAGQQLAELRNMTTPGTDGKSMLVKQADAAAKDGKLGELAKLADESEEKLDIGTRTVAEELNIAENWLLRAEDAKAAGAKTTAAATPTDTAAPTEPASGSGTQP
jgi:hypothetical protein